MCHYGVLPAADPPANETLFIAKSPTPPELAGKTSLHSAATGIRASLLDREWDFVSKMFSPDSDLIEEDEAPGSAGSRPTFTPVSKNL